MVSVQKSEIGYQCQKRHSTKLKIKMHKLSYNFTRCFACTGGKLYFSPQGITSEEHRLRVFEKKVMRRMTGPGTGG
jgi:hypothetical protein